MTNCEFSAYPLSLRQRGLTLVEVVVGVALIGTLAAVAVPSYSNYTRRARVAEGVAQAAGPQIRVAEEAVIGQRDNPNGPEVAWGFALSPDGTFIPPPGTFQVMRVAPTRMVKNIIRAWNTNLVINYSTAFSPETQYSVVLQGRPRGVGMGMDWVCLSGDRARPLLNYYAQGGADVGTALPTEWAPNNCK